MTKNNNELTGPALGIIMRDAIMRAATIIRRMRFDFERENKPAQDGTLTDLVTSADKAAQTMIVKVLQEATPNYGIIAEENLHIEPEEQNRPPRTWVIDPLDGTKAFGRLQSHGIGSMISLLEGNKVIAACIVDVMTGEMYFFRPGSPKVHRLDLNGAHLRLDLLDPTRLLSKQYLLVRKNPWEFAPAIHRRLIPRADRERNLFKDFEIEGGSIGLSFARLWKGEVGGILLLGDNPNYPWDWAPVVGISEKLQYVFLRLEVKSLDVTGTLVPIPYTIELDDNHSPGCSILVIHEKHLDLVSDWIRFYTGPSLDFL